MSVSFVDLLKKLDVGDPLLVVSDDVLVFYTHEGVAVLELAVGVLPKSLVMSHPHSGVVMSVTRTIVGRLVVLVVKRRDNVALDVMHSAGRLSSQRSGALPITRGKYPAMWSSLPPEARDAMLYILSHILGSERPL
jgi:hypothetical protein